MAFGAPRHVVLLILSPNMTDVVWCTPTCGITYSVSHHDGCRLVHPDMWYQLFCLPSCRMPFGAPRHVVSIKCHTPSIRMSIGASRQVGHFFNAIRHQDGCRLVHPAKWDIGKFWGAFVMDVDLCILQAVHSIYQSVHIYDRFRSMNPVLIINYIHSVFKYHISIPYSLSY